MLIVVAEITSKQFKYQRTVKLKKKYSKHTINAMMWFLKCRKSEASRILFPNKSIHFSVDACFMTLIHRSQTQSYNFWN
jgi:hypothetical protein